MKSIRRILSFLLAVVMVLGMVPPVTVRAEETTPPQETVAETIVTEPATEPAPETIPPKTEAEPLPPETSAPVPEQTDPAEEETIAQEAADGDAAEVLTCVSEEITFSDAGLPDNDELFQAYADQVFYGNQVSLFGTAAGSRLTGDEKVLYDALVPILKQIAAGERSSTVISIGQDILSGGVTTAADVNATFTGETVTEESLGRLHNALLSDLPYELYWFRKQLGLRYWSTSTVLLVQLTFHAAGNYQGADSTCVDTAITGAAVKAAENARSIAGKYTDLSDYQKLIAYRDEICSLTSYDHAAASGGSSRVDNDPWQMIHVFDGDTSTNVVCEGYSKAFMYLCEQTDFQGQVDCYTVTGEMNSGGHMWNIVTLEGKNYLVDVTNSDTGTVGQNGGLFLAGGQGSASAGYWVYGVSFVYYGDELEQWGTGADSILTLSETDYTPSVCANGHTEVIDPAVEPDCTNTGLTEGKHCSVCGEVITAQTVIAAKGHTEVIDPAVEPDCTNTGLTEGKHCSVCGEIITTQTVIPAKGHTEVTDAAVEPDCTSTGLTEGKHCSACGEVITAQEVIPAGHTVANGICTRCQAYGTCGENLTWTFDAASGTLTVSGTGEMENYSQNSAPWTPLGNDIKQIVVENGVTGIGDWAFYCCTYLEKASIPASICQVGTFAFSNIIGDRQYVIDQTVRQWSQIQEETQYFPNWETTSFVNEAPIVASGLYGEHVFWELDESGNMVFFGNGAMYDFGAVPTPWGALAVNSITIEEGITRIGHCAFEVSGTDVFSNTFESITIPSSVASIGGLAFSNCKALKTITFMGDAPVFDPDSLNSFNGVTATAYYPAGNPTWTSSVMQNYGGNITWTSHCSNGHTEVIDEAVAPTCTEPGLTEGTHCAVCNVVITAQEEIPAGHIVENSICTRCGVYGTCGENLTWTLDEDGVLTISGHGPMAEYNYNSTPWFTKRLSIQSIIVENGAESIIPLAFYYCENVKEITLPDSVKTIGMGAFRYCSSLETITLPAGLTVVESNLFSACGSLKTISLPEGITRLGESAFNGCGSLEEITIPAGVTHLDKWALSGCWNITKIIFTGDAPIIAEDAFTWISGTAYYPAGNPTWTKAFMKDYGGTITWASHQDGHIHTEVIDEAVSPSYTKSGLTEGKHCSDCNEVLVAQQTIPALGLLKPVVTVSGPDEATGIPTLTWEAVPEADAYGIYRATSKTGKYAPVDTVAENIYEETYAAPGKTYYYKVKAIYTPDETLNSPYSAVVSAKVKVARPVITVKTDEATGKPMISWEKVEGAKKYTVYRATSENGKYSSLKSTSGTSCTDTKATVGKTYFYKVVAQPSSSSYKSADSEILSCLTIYAQPKVTVKLDAATGKPVLSWAKVHKSVQYVVSYADSQEGPYTALEPQTALTWTDSDAAVDVDRFYMVQTVAADETLNSIPTEKNAHTIPAKPVVTAKSDPESGKPVITWNQVEGAAEYMISRATKSSGSYMVIQSTAETAFTDDAATVGKTYYYKVTALAANSASAASSYKSAKCVCAQPVIQVEADQVTGKPLISWEKVEGAKKYTVYRAASENGKYSSIKSTSGTSCTDTKATVGKTYFYKVVAQPSSSSYKSTDSNILSCLTIYGQPKVTVKPDAVTGKPVLSWAKVHKSVKYVVSFADSLEGPYTSLEPQSTLTWTDVNAVVDTVRFYKVQTVAADETLNSFPAEVSACATPAKPVVTAKSDPASGKPMVSWTAVDGAIRYEVYRSTKSSSGFKPLDTVEDAESYTDSTAAKGKTYYYKVIAVSRNASSAYSNAVKIKSK